jgi:hypothetical protein
VSGLVAGTYVFRLTVTDNGALTASDDVTLTVNPAATVNLALLKPVTVSSIEAVGTPGSAAVDGVATSRWSSVFSDPQWLYVDLGATYSISQVKITWEAAYGRDYVVEVSPNASAWSPLRTVTGNTALVNDLTGLSGSGRYVRVYGTTRGTPYGYSIYELEVYGTAAGARTAAPESITPILAEEDPVFFYPNPAHDVLRIEGLADGTEVGFLSTTGARQYTQRVENQAVSIGHLPAGIYVVRYRQGARNVQRKLIKL